VWAAVPLLIAAFAASCGGGGDAVTEEQARALLPRMVLQPEDVPEGLEQAGEQFTTNEQLAGPGIGVRPGIEKIEEWGRILGYERDFQAAGVGGSGPPVIGVNTAASFYETPEGASASFAEVAQQARDTDWAQFYTDLTEFQVREVDRDVPADEILWLRLSGQRPSTTGDGLLLLVDDQIVFRVGQVRAFLRVLISQEDATDRDLALERTEALLQTQIQHIRDTLESME